MPENEEVKSSTPVFWVWSFRFLCLIDVNRGQHEGKESQRKPNQGE